MGAGHSFDRLVSVVAPCIRTLVAWICTHRVPPQCWGLGHPNTHNQLRDVARLRLKAGKETVPLPLLVPDLLLHT